MLDCGWSYVVLCCCATLCCFFHYIYRIQTLSDVVCGHGLNQDRVLEGLDTVIRLADRCWEAIDCCRWLSLVSMVADTHPTNQEALMKLKAAEKAMEVW